MTVPDQSMNVDPAQAQPGGHALDGDTAMTLSAERLLTATRWIENGRLTVRRRVVSETRTVEVTLRREELVVEETRSATDLPAGTGADSLPGRTGAAEPGVREPLVVVLRREVPVIGVRVEAYEQVRLTTNWVTTEQNVQSSVRHEEVDYAVETRPDSQR